MKKIIICMLLMILIFLSTNLSIAEKIHNTSHEDNIDLPQWDVGDIWTYSGYYKFNLFKLFNFKLNLENINFTVDQETNNFYYLDFKGDINFKIGMRQPRFNIATGNIDGDLTVNKSNLGFSQFYYHITGEFLNKPLEIFVNYTLSPDFLPLKFPFTIGDSWNSLAINIVQEMKIRIFGSENIDEDRYILPSINFKCFSSEEITVPAGTYSTYKISASDYFDIYYNSTVKNFIRIYWADEKQITTVKAELVYTNFKIDL